MSVAPITAPASPYPIFTLLSGRAMEEYTPILFLVAAEITRLHFGSTFQIMRIASSPSISTRAIKSSFSLGITDCFRIPQLFRHSHSHVSFHYTFPCSLHVQTQG